MKMKTILAILFFSIASLTAFSQDPKPDTKTNSQITTNAVVYRLFPTQNTFIFIKLNTQTGQMWLVQWGLEADKQTQQILSLEVLSYMEVNDRFTLQKTENIFNFILLDQHDG